MRMANEEKEHYSKIAKEYNLTLAQYIREGMEVLERNPSFLDITSNPYLSAISKAQEEATQERDEYIQTIESRLTNLEKSTGNIERILEKLALSQGLSKKDIKKAQKKDISNEAVFD